MGSSVKTIENACTRYIHATLPTHSPVMDVFCVMGTERLMKASSLVCTDSQQRHRVSVRSRPSKISSTHVCLGGLLSPAASAGPAALLRVSAVPLVPSASPSDALMSSDIRLTRKLRNSWASCCCVRVNISGCASRKRNVVCNVRCELWIVTSCTTWKPGCEWRVEMHNVFVAVIGGNNNSHISKS